jgi:cytochrome b pre-mRNA-processing protein 3
MPLASFFRRNGRHAAVDASYARIVAQSREPLFFAAWGVPDTLDGRFEVLALHAFLVLNRLKAERAATAAHAQALFDAMFADLDRGLREMGVGDLSVGRQVKAMARGFYGRIVAYEQGLGADDAALRAALRRNLYGTAAPEERQLDAAAAYVRRQTAALAAAPVARLLEGEVPFAAAEA